MAGQEPDRPSTAGGTPVPDLIERYRLRRDAWIAQADELARLRDEVRGSAEREAMEIVTAARHNVRQVIMEARRELLVLSAQVQAALGEATPKDDPVTLLHKAGVAAGEHQLQSTRPPEPGFAPESSVDEILDEIQADMQALVDDARALPLQEVEAPEPVAGETWRSEPAAVEPWDLPPEVRSADGGESLAQVEPAAETSEETVSQTPESPAFRSLAGLSDAASRALLSSPVSGDAVPVPKGRSLRTFVGLFVGIGVVVVLGTFWWNRGQATREVPQEASAAAAVAPTAATVDRAAADGTPVDAAPEPVDSPLEGAAAVDVRGPVAGRGPVSGNLSIAAQALREVWVRTTIDGRADQGRTLAAGDTIRASAERSIALRVGDAGALAVSVNQGEQRPLGPDGLVMTRQFVVDGVTAGPREEEASPASVPSSQPAQSPTVPTTTPAGPTGPPVAQVPPPLTSPAQRLSPAAGGAPAPATTSASEAISPATAVVAAARQWLDAYHRQDNATMSALSTENLLLADERRPDERFPSGLGDVQRTLDRVSVQVAADTAVLTAVMTEQSTSSATPMVSPVSQVWVRGGDGRWRVRQARFVSEARLSQVFR